MFFPFFFSPLVLHPCLCLSLLPSPLLSVWLHLIYHWAWKPGERCGSLLTSFLTWALWLLALSPVKWVCWHLPHKAGFSGNWSDKWQVQGPQI
jgi:hypothetical protein